MVVVSSKKTKQKKTLDSWRLFERLQKKLNTSHTCALHTWTIVPPTSCIIALDTLFNFILLCWFDKLCFDK